MENHSQPAAARISVVRCTSYDSRTLADALRAALEPLGGIEQFVRPGQRVLLKPNFVLARRCDEAANTHPAFVLETARLVREAGGNPVVGDSPALGSARHVAARCGLLAGALAEALPIVEFRSTRWIPPPHGSAGRPLRVADAALDADVVINLPKLKVHGQMYLTLAVKNLFGCVKGRRKALLHQQLGGRPLEFARMLVDVCQAVRPALTLMDGIVGMERHGPTGGDPRPLGLIVAGTDCTALDRVVCEIIRADPGRLLTLQAAREEGFGQTDLDRIQVLGDGREIAPPFGSLVPALAGRPFRLVEHLAPLSFSPWRILRGLLRQAWSRLAPPKKESAG